MSAAHAWTTALGEWAIPREILDRAPEEPWHFPPELMRWTPASGPAPGSASASASTPAPGAGGAGAPRADRAVPGPSYRRAAEAIPEGGSVLDVGVAGGRASLPLVPPAALVVGVDTNAELLAAFAQAATGIGVAHEAVLGQWPAVADQAPVGSHDVVVCHHVLYNVADLVPFLRALTDHARRRVVVELTTHHPQENLNQAWRVLHGIERPTRPMAGDAIAVLGEMGLHVTAEASEAPLAHGGQGRDRAQLLAFARRRLCVGPDRDAEIDALLGADFERTSRQVVTIWWDGEAG